jgi:hypothetical protein
MTKTSAADAIIAGLRAVTKDWATQRKAEERDASRRARRHERLVRWREQSIKDVAYGVMRTAYLKASANGTMPATARQVMYAARPLIQEETGKQLDDQYFTQQLLPDYMRSHGVSWNVVFDDRGHFYEPHTECSVPQKAWRAAVRSAGILRGEGQDARSGLPLQRCAVH